MATAPKSKTRSRRQVLQAAVAAPLAAGLAVNSLGANVSPKLNGSANASESFAPSPSFDPFDLYIAVITSYGDSRVAFASLVDTEIEHYVETYNRINEGSHTRADMVCVRVPTPGLKAEVFAAIIDRDGQPAEVCAVGTHKRYSEAFAFTWNSLSGKHGHDSKARVVRGVAQFGGQR